MKTKNLFIAAILLMGLSAEAESPAKDISFARGADVSWVTEMEAQGRKFYTRGPGRVEKECMELLRDDCGVNAIRLRVWVNPKRQWNAIPDVVKKAARADSLGMRVMIDFHFSDSWADPGKQVIPAAWQNLDLDGLCKALAGHVDETLKALKAAGVSPEWVQIGNETTPGMLLPVGSIDNPKELTALNNAGYDAVKAVFPDAKVIVHLDQGNDRRRYDRMFGLLEANGGKYDMIGMSLYPYWVQDGGDKRGWLEITEDCIANVDYVTKRYGKPVMICEIGEHWSKGEQCKAMIEKMMTADVEGIFYWEPEAPARYNGGYQLGCFENDAPTVALDAFKE